MTDKAAPTDIAVIERGFFDRAANRFFWGFVLVAGAIWWHAARLTTHSDHPREGRFAYMGNADGGGWMILDTATGDIHRHTYFLDHKDLDDEVLSLMHAPPGVKPTPETRR